MSAPPAAGSGRWLEMPSRDRARFLLRVGAALGLFVVVDKVYFYAFYYGFNSTFPRLAELGQALTPLDFSFLVSRPYDAPFMLGAGLTHPIFGPALAATAAVPFIAYRDLAWSGLRSGRWIRFWITWLAAVLAWAFSTYDYNLYVDRAHHLDRLLLIALAALVWRHPAFLSLFLPHCLLMMSQFLHPLGWLSVTDKSLVFSMLILFQTFLYLRAFGALGQRLAASADAGRGRARRAVWRLAGPFRGLDSGFFLYLALCSVGVHYFAPAYTKIAISPHGFEWMLDDELAADTVFTFERGWLSGLADRTLDRIVTLVHVLATPLLVGTMAIEVAALFMVVRRSLSVTLLALFAGFHGVIMAFAGVFFWKWILLDLGLIVVLLRLDDVSLREIYSRRAVAVSLAIVAGGLVVFHPTMLGWFDTRYHTASRLEVVGESGRRYVLDKSFFDPYEMFFTFDKYPFLDRKKTLFVGSWNVDYDQSIRIREAGKDGIRDLVRAEGRIPYDEARSRQLEAFVKTFFSRLNRRGSKEVWLSHLAAPHHIFMAERGDVYALQEPVAELWVTFYEQYWDGETITLLSESRVGPIRIPDRAPAAGAAPSTTAED